MKIIRQKGDREDLEELIWLWFEKHGKLEGNYLISKYIFE